MSNIAVSVCISVHNTAKYLPRCLDSVVGQSLESLEIVLVNNGSTDNSEDIMRDYEKRFPFRRFVIVSQEDRGLAQGRQSGVNNASGDYITFLDADDLVSPDAYRLMYETAIKNNSEIVEIETVKGDEIICSPYEGLVDASQILKDYFKGNGIPSMLWMRLYKRELMNKPVFPDLYTNNEDMFALPCLLSGAKHVYFIRKPMHTYSIDNESAVMLNLKKKNSRKYFESRTKVLNMFSHIESFIGEERIQKDYNKEYERFKARFVLSYLITRFEGVSYDEKMTALMPILNASSIKETEKKVNDFCRTQKDLTYRLIKAIGIKNTYRLYTIIHKI